MSLIADGIADGLMAPWMRTDTGWALRLHTEHVITMALTERLWMWTWQRGPGLTIHESSGYPTMNACIRSIWSFVFELYEDYHRMGIEAAKRAHLEASSS